MIWNVYLYSHYSSEKLFPVRGYDNRPLRFTEKRYADRYVHELNTRWSPLDQLLEEDGINYAVFEDEGEDQLEG